MGEQPVRWKPVFPGWALATSSWADRTPRTGWQVRYTTVGARPRTAPFPEDRRLMNGLASALVATRGDALKLEGDSEFWVTTTRRYLQRGTLPPIGAEGPAVATSPSLLSALFSPQEVSVDPNLKLDETYEVPFFEHVRRTWPMAAQFLFPQAPFESLGDLEHSPTQRWVDFLFAPPGQAPQVLEIDGNHSHRVPADDERDVALGHEGIAVLRADGADSMDPGGELLQAISGWADESPEEESVIAWRNTLLAARSAFGIVEAVSCGALQPGTKWLVNLPSGLGDETVMLSLLTALAALDKLWGTGVVPAEIDVSGMDECTWKNPWPPGDGHGGTTSAVSVLVDWGPAWASLPDVVDGPEVVVRGIPLPTHPGWSEPSEEDVFRGQDQLPSRNRRNLGSEIRDEGEDVFEQLLLAVSGPVFGIREFRDGQSRAVKRVLAGGDCCVLLPTGYGKTLVFQVAGLVRPGLTLVVAPIKALIDDLERRFVECGIDRVAAIHGGRSFDGVVEVLHAGVGRQNALFVLVAPERLQIQRFRDSLEQAVGHGIVGLLVVDEMHCVSEWGHDFRVSYLRLGRNLRYLCRGDDDVPPPLLALTGTASPGVLRDVVRELEIDDLDSEAIQRTVEFDRPNLGYQILVGPGEESFSLLREAIFDEIPSHLGLEFRELVEPRGEDTASGIVFVPWARGGYGTLAVRKRLLGWFADAGVTVPIGAVDDLEGEAPAGPPVIETYSGRNPSGNQGGGLDHDWERRRILAGARFRNNEAPILVATKAFGMGIDKPNIRWTTHLGMPSSIEAFAQEAGRAGRDGERSHCVIASGQTTRADVSNLLDVGTPAIERHAAFRSIDRHRVDDDVKRQLFFLYNSFPGYDPDEHVNRSFSHALDRVWVSGEAAQASSMWDELLENGAAPLAKKVIPRLPSGAHIFDHQTKDNFRTLRDKVLYRLSLAGVIDDLTIEYGSDEVTIYFADYSGPSVDEALRTSANRIKPSRLDRHEAAIRAAPPQLDERIRHHLDYIVRLVYEVIEPARLNALREMWRLTLDQPDDHRIRSTINAYLSDGPMATTLQFIVSQDEVDLEEAFRLIDLAPPVDPFEWAGAAIRQLEGGAAHPVVRLVRALGEANLPDGRPEVFLESFELLLDNAYELTDSQFGEIFLWSRNHLKHNEGGRRADWIPALWAIFLERETALGLLEGLAGEVIGNPLDDPSEVEVVLTWALRQIIDKADALPLPGRRS